ncbi:hypothetical protein CGRA01v4_07260 [Colletotrichum graminicola]|nr:hypothetical protein CGRA01v4_07260 [Colletotrichum graminicola]
MISSSIHHRRTLTPHFSVLPPQVFLSFPFLFPFASHLFQSFPFLALSNSLPLFSDFILLHFDTIRQLVHRVWLTPHPKRRVRFLARWFHCTSAIYLYPPRTYSSHHLSAGVPFFTGFFPSTPRHTIIPLYCLSFIPFHLLCIFHPSQAVTSTSRRLSVRHFFFRARLLRISIFPNPPPRSGPISVVKLGRSSA